MSMSSLSTSLSVLRRRLEVFHPAGYPRPTRLCNNDIVPIEEGRRTWGWPAYFSLWSVVAFNMTNFQVGSSLLAVGLNWWQTALATLVGHGIAAVLLIASSYPGLEYHIAFPVATRIGWGFYGTVFVVLNRIALSIIWFGVQSWQGGLVTYVCLRSIWPSTDKIPNTIPSKIGMTLPEFVGFIVFWVIQFPFLLIDSRRLKSLLYISAACGFVAQLSLVAWACGTMGPQGFGQVLSSQSQLPNRQIGWMFVYGVSITMASITSGTLSVCDYTRFAKRPSAGTWSQGLGAVPAWLANVFGMLTIAATQRRYGSELWSVASLLIAVQNANPNSRTRVAVFFCGLSFMTSQLTVNIVGNSFSGGTDMSTLLPKYINIRRGQVITSLLGLAINPWYLVSGAVVFISVISSYTVFLQPFLGILVAHYFVVQQRRIKVSDLYITGHQSLYWYTTGVNCRAVVAWVVGVAPHVAGFLNVVKPSISVSAGTSHLYYINSLTGFVIPFSIIVLWDFIAPVKKQKSFVHSISTQEARDLYREDSSVNETTVQGSMPLGFRLANTENEKSLTEEQELNEKTPSREVHSD